MIAFNSFKEFTHIHKLILLIYILEAGPSEVHVYINKFLRDLKSANSTLIELVRRRSSLFRKYRPIGP